MASVDHEVLVQTVRGSIYRLAEQARCTGEEEQIGALYDEALEALEVMFARCRALECLEEAVIIAAAHTVDGTACSYVAQMARRAQYITDLGFQVVGE